MHTKGIRVGIKFLVVLTTCCVVTVIVGRLSTAAAEAPADSLWAKAVALWSLNDDLVPGLIKMHMQEVDKHGEIKDEAKYHEVWSTLGLGEDGEVESGMVKVIENGEDVTEKEKAKLESEQDAEKSEGQGKDDEDSESQQMEGYSPFDSESQARVSLKSVGPGGSVSGRSTLLYEFTERTEKDVEFTGKAWLDAGTGAPVKIEYTLDPLPKRVKHMVTTMEYEHIAPDSLIVRSMAVDVTGGILFIKKHFHMAMTFDDYWRLPEDYKSRHAKE
jgi:hypothetical protein